MPFKNMIQLTSKNVILFYKDKMFARHLPQSAIFLFHFSAINIYMDTLNIFIRIVSILAGGGSRRK